MPVSLSFFGCQKVSAQTRTSIAAEAELRALDARWSQAISARDTVFVSRLLAPGFQLIVASGEAYSRAQVLTATANPAVEIEPYQSEDVRVQLMGRTAVVTGRFTQVLHYQGKTSTTRYRYTDVYHRQGRRWLALAAHASVLKE